MTFQKEGDFEGIIYSDIGLIKLIKNTFQNTKIRKGHIGLQNLIHFQLNNVLNVAALMESFTKSCE